MSFYNGQNVMYNSKCCTIFRTPGIKVFNINYVGYQLRENKTGIVHNNIPEDQISNCNCPMIVNDVWDDFIYTGDDFKASSWIVKNIITHIENSGDCEWGHNIDSTQYYFKMAGQTWTKNKTN